MAPARVPGAVGGDAHDGDYQNRVIQPVHEYALVKSNQERNPDGEHHQDENVNPAPRAHAGKARPFIARCRLRRHFPSEIRFAKRRYAPGTPAGSCRKNASPV